MRKVISIDPGKEKCGLLLADIDQLIVLDGKIVRKNYVIELISHWYKIHSVDFILLGNGTSSRVWKNKLALNKFSSIILVDETNTTLRAKDRYLELKPQRFFLQSFLEILVANNLNLDSIAALIMLEDYLENKLQWKEPIELKIWP